MSDQFCIVPGLGGQMLIQRLSVTQVILEQTDVIVQFFPSSAPEVLFLMRQLGKPGTILFIEKNSFMVSWRFAQSF